MDEEQAAAKAAIEELIASNSTIQSADEIWSMLNANAYIWPDFWPQADPFMYLELEEDDLYQLGEYGEIGISLDWGSGPGGSSGYRISSYIVYEHIVLVDDADRGDGEGPVVIAVAPIQLKHELHAYVMYVMLDVRVAMQGAPDFDFVLNQNAPSMRALIRAYQRWGFRHAGGGELIGIEASLATTDLPAWLETIAPSDVDRNRVWADTGDKVTVDDEAALLHLARIIATCEAGLRRA